MKYYRYPVDIPPAYITWGFAEWDNSVLTSQRYQHRGIDIGCPVGTPMYSPGAGTVYEHKGDGSFGLNVAIAHDDGYYSIMAHMSNPIVKPGDIVKPGQLVGYSGNTGLSTGPHVHWQVCLDSWFPRDISRSRDPETFLVNEPIPEDEMTPDQLELLVKTAEALVGPGEENKAVRSLIERLAPLSAAPLYPNLIDQQEALDAHTAAPHGGMNAASFNTITIGGFGLMIEEED